MNCKVYQVSRRDKKPLLDFIFESLELCGCTVLNYSNPDRVPFQITFEAPDGERMGIIVYAFLANSKLTKNRPSDEHRFQVKYGSKPTEHQELWQDPFELYTTLFLGINPERKFFVGADPFLHNPTQFFISVEFKEENVKEIEKMAWAWWERPKRPVGGLEKPIEVMIGGLPESFLSYVRFERAAKGLDQGHRALLADKVEELTQVAESTTASIHSVQHLDEEIQPLANEFQLSQDQILDVIRSAPRLKMAVRGWVAEKHLYQKLSEYSEITECEQIEKDGMPDFRIVYRDCPILIECKNVLRKVYSDNQPRVDFQKTRASKKDPCTRYYKTDKFDVVAACLHPRTEKWEFAYTLTREMDPHPKCVDRLSNNVRVNESWSSDLLSVLDRALI